MVRNLVLWSHLSAPVTLTSLLVRSSVSSSAPSTDHHYASLTWVIDIDSQPVIPYTKSFLRIEVPWINLNSEWVDEGKWKSAGTWYWKMTPESNRESIVKIMARRSQLVSLSTPADSNYSLTIVYASRRQLLIVNANRLQLFIDCASRWQLFIFYASRG